MNRIPPTPPPIRLNAAPNYCKKNRHGKRPWRCVIQKVYSLRQTTPHKRLRGIYTYNPNGTARCQITCHLGRTLFQLWRCLMGCSHIFILFLSARLKIEVLTFCVKLYKSATSSETRSRLPLSSSDLVIAHAIQLHTPNAPKATSGYTDPGNRPILKTL